MASSVTITVQKETSLFCIVRTGGEVVTSVDRNWGLCPSAHGGPMYNTASYTVYNILPYITQGRRVLTNTVLIMVNRGELVWLHLQNNQLNLILEKRRFPVYLEVIPYFLLFFKRCSVSMSSGSFG